MDQPLRDMIARQQAHEFLIEMALFMVMTAIVKPEDRREALNMFYEQRAQPVAGASSPQEMQTTAEMVRATNDHLDRLLDLLVSRLSSLPAAGLLRH